jgi:Ca2+-binding EF-hand superfamily protein
MDHEMHDMKSADKIAKMDTNGDGVLSASEHASGAQAMFSEMDTDGNGSLSRQEMAAGHAMMKSEKKGAEKTP